MLASTMPEVIAPGTDRAVALCRDVIGWPGTIGVGRTRQFPAEGQPGTWSLM